MRDQCPTLSQVLNVVASTGASRCIATMKKLKKPLIPTKAGNWSRVQKIFDHGTRLKNVGPANNHVGVLGRWLGLIPR